MVLRAAAAAFVLAGLALGVIRWVGASDPERGAEGALSCCAFGVAIAAPGIVALTGRRGIVVIGAAVAAFGVAFLASFGVTLPLLIPAAMLLARGMRELRADGGDGLRALVVAVAVPWAVVILDAHDDPLTTATASTSDVTVWWESSVSLGLSALAIVASRPGAHEGERGVGVAAGADRR